MSVIYPTKTHYTEHFTRRELDCHCGCDAPLSIEKELYKTALALEQLRVHTGPLHINSGYRCPAYNARIGGAKESQHMLGTAADISQRDRHPSAVRSLALTISAFNKGGIGSYAGFTHVDRRSNGPARWTG